MECPNSLQEQAGLSCRWFAMHNELLQRADESLAESERLIDQLYEARRKAAQLKTWRHDLRQRRIQETEKRSKVPE
jgi:hypothetical protein